MSSYGSDRKRRDPQITYRHKVAKITTWYNRLIKYREEHPIIINPNTKKEVVRKELKDLQYYIDKVKKPQGESK